MKRPPQYGDILLAEIFGIEFTGLNRQELWQTAQTLARLKIAEAENELHKFKERMEASGIDPVELPKFHIISD